MSYSSMYLAFIFTQLETGKNPDLAEISCFTRILEEEFFDPKFYKNVLHLQASNIDKKRAPEAVSSKWESARSWNGLVHHALGG